MALNGTKYGRNDGRKRGKYGERIRPPAPPHTEITAPSLDPRPHWTSRGPNIGPTEAPLYTTADQQRTPDKGPRPKVTGRRREGDNLALLECGGIAGEAI
mgnify:CR=1 FL=1